MRIIKLHKSAKIWFCCLCCQRRNWLKLNVVLGRLRLLPGHFDILSVNLRVLPCHFDILSVNLRVLSGHFEIKSVKFRVFSCRFDEVR